MGDDNLIRFPGPDVVAEVGGLVDETRVTLGIYGLDLDPDEITALLACEPTAAHRRGESRSNRVQPWPQGAWLLSVEGKAPVKPEELLNALLGKLPSDPAIWEGLRRKFSVRLGFGLFLDAWNRGFDLSPEVLKRAEAIGAPMGFDIYGDAYGQDG